MPRPGPVENGPRLVDGKRVRCHAAQNPPHRVHGPCSGRMDPRRGEPHRSSTRTRGIVERKTVLLIATPDASADAHQRALQDAGMAVLRASDGLTGMRDALGEQPDAVVLDFSADDAPDVLRARRALREAGIPLLVLVDGEIAAGDDAADGAAITFLRIPVEPGRLVAETTRAMDVATPSGKRARDGAPRT